MDFLKARKPIHFGADKADEQNASTSVYKIYKSETKITNRSKRVCGLKKQIIIKQLENYCVNSTLHGLKYIGDKKIPFIERFFWFVAFIIAIGFALYFITNIYQRYDQSPVIISFNPKLVQIKDIPFPAITICNVNMALKSRANYINKYGSDLHKQLLADLCSTKNYSTFQNTTTEEDDHGFDWPTVRELIININQKCTEMFKLCKWDGNFEECSKFINTILTDEGYCCSFNRMPVNYSLRNDEERRFDSHYPKNVIDWNPEDGYPRNTPLDSYPYRSFGSGQQLGLTMVLDTNLDEYYCTTTNSIGFKILLSTPIESPKVADVGMLISPGDETRIAIEADIEDATIGVKDINYKKRQCFFARERYLRFFRIYTERNCRMECEANYTMKKCGCVPYFLPKDQNTRVCNQKTEACTYEAKFTIERYSPERRACNCLPACYEINYLIRSISVGTILKDIKTVPKEYRPNMSMEYFSENAALVHFYFAHDKFSKRTKGEIYGFAEFLSNTGGLLGLFLGFSFLSAVEILYFVCLSNISRYMRRVFKKTNVQHNILVYPYTD